MALNRKSVTIISYAWPSTDTGSGFAVMSLLKECKHVFDEVQLIGLRDSEPNTSQPIYEDMRYVHIQTRRLPMSVRFLLSIGSSLPAVCHQYKSKKNVDKVLEAIRQMDNRSNESVVIFEDLPIAITLLNHIRKQFPGIRVAIRSENVLSKVFDPLTQQGNPLLKLAWHIEVSKMRRREVAACKEVDRVWAISLNDQQEYSTKLGIMCDGVFGVGLDSAHFATIPSGDSETIVFVGGVDLRKRLGILNFVKNAWPLIRSEVPNARFILAGSGSERFDDPSLGIHGLGYVADDREVWAKGQIALNPQELGSGIKLKSIISMLSAKALVSTEIGVEGIEGENGKHFLVAPDTLSLGPLVIRLMKNPTQAKQMGQVAGEWARQKYSEQRLRQSVSPLLEEFAGIHMP